MRAFMIENTLYGQKRQGAPEIEKRFNNVQR
jgi:hypothetical protein